MIIMNYNTEILSLWIGPQSQQAAHHFYSLQAEQFFEDNEDPINHQALWNVDTKTDERFPKMIVFDTKSDHLTTIRHIDHSKMLKKMKQTNAQQTYFNFFAPPPPPEEEPEEAKKDTQLFQNWEGKEDNYVLMDKKFNEEARSFEFWEEMYKIDQDTYEDRIRKRLQTLDFLHVLSFCSDGARLGFSNRLLNLMQESCPKKTILFTNLSQTTQDDYFSQVCLPLLSEISSEVTILIDVDTRPVHFNYFEANFYHHFSPLFNALLTPFILKDNNSHDYISQICSGKKTLFDLAFTLPIINQKNELSNSTNIFNYLPNKKSNGMDDEINRVNYANRSFLDVFQYTPSGKQLKLEHEKHWKTGIAENISYSSQKILSQSYVLKGHFNQISKLCNQRSQQFDIKYLKGIFEGNPSYKLNYSQFYQKAYGQKVVDFPMHTVLYQHTNFGSSIRNYLKSHHSNATKNESFNEWKEGAINLADLYGQDLAIDSD